MKQYNISTNCIYVIYKFFLHSNSTIESPERLKWHW